MNISNLRGSGNRKSPIAWDFPRHVKLKIKIPNGAAEIASFNHCFKSQHKLFVYTFRLLHLFLTIPKNCQGVYVNISRGVLQQFVGLLVGKNSPEAFMFP